MNRTFDIDSFDFIISDTHFFHDNIVRYSLRPGYDPYGNHDFNKHNDMMVENWLRLVKPKDRILHLGDVSMGKSAQFEELGPTLSGEKFLILGNHDKGSKFYEGLGFKVIPPFSFQQEGAFDILFTHYPKRHLRGNEINIHGHIHNNPCDFLTRRHSNMSVEVIGYQPLPFRKVVENALYNAKGSSDLNFQNR